MTYQPCRGFDSLSRPYLGSVLKGLAVDVTPLKMPHDEIESLAGRIAARVHPRWCGQSAHGSHHIEWVVMVVDGKGGRHWTPVGMASREYLEFVLDQPERDRWVSIAVLVDAIDRFISDNVSGIPTH